MEKNKIDVVVLGAGFTGLATADFLLKSGFNVLVLEKEKEVGGLAKTFTFDGFKFDLGGHRLYFNNKKLINYVRSVAKSELIFKKRRSSIFLKGQYLNYPPRFFDCFRHSSSNIFKIIYDHFRLFGKNKKGSSTFKEWVISRFGVTVHDIYFHAYSYKTWGLRTDMISSLLAKRRIGMLNSSLIIKEMFTQHSRVKENARYFYYPTEGIGSLSRDLMESVLKNNGQVILDAQIQNISYDNNKLESLFYSKECKRIKVEFSKLISTVPLLSLTKLLFSEQQNEMHDLFQLIRYRDLILIFLLIDKKKVFDSQWIYFPDSDIPFARITEPKNWSTTMSRNNMTSLCVEIFCQAGDKYWNMPDDDLVKITMEALSKLKAVLASEVKGAFLKRIPYAYPLMYLGYEKDLNMVLSQVLKFDNLQLCGRNGTHTYLDMEECLSDAQQVAASLEER